jgi:hypothetical protein
LGSCRISSARRSASLAARTSCVALASKHCKNPNKKNNNTNTTQKKKIAAQAKADASSGEEEDSGSEIGGAAGSGDEYDSAAEDAAFSAAMASSSSKQKKKQSKKSAAAADADDADDAAAAVAAADEGELALLVADADESKHFNLKDIAKRQRAASKAHRDYAIDPTRPEFLKTAEMQRVLAERQRRVHDNDVTAAPQSKRAKKRQ